MLACSLLRFGIQNLKFFFLNDKLYLVFILFVFINWDLYVVIKITTLLGDEVSNFLYLLRLIYKNNTNQLIIYIYIYIFKKHYIGEILNHIVKYISF